MPIYVYRCSHCGHTQDVLQKISDPLLHSCPACGQETYEKQVTAASFHLKGTGWYATDFRDKGGRSEHAENNGKAASEHADGPPSRDVAKTDASSGQSAETSPSKVAKSSAPPSAAAKRPSAGAPTATRPTASGGGAAAASPD